MNYIEFKGDFKQLIPNGYKFLRLFAGNHICYRFYPVEYSQSLWIWRASKSVELDSCYGVEGSILEYLINHNFELKNNLVYKNGIISEDSGCWNIEDAIVIRMLNKNILCELKRLYDNGYIEAII